MKAILSCAAAAAALISTGCATPAATPAGMKSGEFVTFNCEGGKRFQARLAQGGESVRLRYEGGYELDRKDAGVYEGEGWKLDTGRPGGAEVLHNGKPALQNCKAAA